MESPPENQQLYVPFWKAPSKTGEGAEAGDKTRSTNQTHGHLLAPRAPLAAGGRGSTQPGAASPCNDRVSISVSKPRMN